MPTGFQIQRHVGGQLKLKMGYYGETPESAALSQKDAEQHLQALFDGYLERGIDVKRDEYTIVSIGDVPYVRGFPPPEPLPSCYKR